ncbi:hypothetical protein [Roseovarius atlanticus]|mgnify:CR=1 FL=1|uniref:hypothetical protein n=1 Tax=Roseovarius atlanticus TaxID=1641875 RepID=UPI00070A0DDB|nr:hypothetical protein [Roseovarius atlanticus]
MYGAVLWADRCTNRALIWCEDHGDLAFFEGEPANMSDASTFEEGDFVAFKIRDGRGMRLAFEVKVVTSDEYPRLARDLRGAASKDVAAASPAAPERKILPFVAPTGTRGRDAAISRNTGNSLEKLRQSR